MAYKKTLNEELKERVVNRLKTIKCDSELIHWLVEIERDRHFLRKRLGNSMIQNGKNLNAISRSVVKY